MERRSSGLCGRMWARRSYSFFAIGLPSVDVGDGDAEDSGHPGEDGGGGVAGGDGVLTVRPLPYGWDIMSPAPCGHGSVERGGWRRSVCRGDRGRVVGLPGDDTSVDAARMSARATKTRGAFGFTQSYPRPVREARASIRVGLGAGRLTGS